MTIFKRWNERAQELKVQTYALYLACRDPEVPWYAKLWITCVVGYALSPIDLIPDFIPVLGYLDDLIIVPLGITLALKMIPAGVMEKCRMNARNNLVQDKSKHWLAAGIIVAVWLIVIALIIAFIIRTFYKPDSAISK